MMNIQRDVVVGESLASRNAGTRKIAAIYGVTVAVWLLFDRSAAVLGSTRGEGGFLVAALVLTALLLAERAIHGRGIRDALRALGCGAPARQGLARAATASVLLIAVLPLYASFAQAHVALRSDWLRLVPGLFAQAGLAEELLFRGYLFGRLREDRGFWRAALLALPPFFLVHILLFATMSFPLALAATLLSLVISFPLARLYDAGEKTMWGPAILHAVVQGGIKVVDVPEAEMMGLATTWMAASMLIPWIAFVRRPRTAR